jgi:DNA-binding NarL/FixJ family response regulator
VFSQYIEARYAADLLGAASGQAAAGVGYLLKDRVADVSEFVDALSRIAAGGTAEPAVEKHIGNIFSKLGLPPSDSGHRRVLAVLRYLES